MIMTRTNKEEREGHGLAGVVGRLNRILLPWIGPPPLGPYTRVTATEAETTRTQARCPICSELMSLHEIDRSGERTQVYHPTPEQVAERSVVEPLSETGPEVDELDLRVGLDLRARFDRRWLSLSKPAGAADRLAAQ